jgi:hypothetical protein
MEKKKIDKVIEAFRHYINLKEEGMVTGGPTNNVGGGQIAGTPEADPGNPPVFKKKKKNIYLGIGSRKRWMKPKN